MPWSAALLPLLLAGTSPGPRPVADDWAYHPVTRPAVPPRQSGHVTAVDAFLLEKLAARGLSFAPPAEKAALLRRVTFDLTGLPPTPDDLAAFLADDSPGAYEKVVDRLLASPRFGERVALWWLDLVRYAESEGFKSDEPRPNAWRYRDYVIAAFNADKPYDRFVKEQLAGDELFPDSTDALVATGFLRHFPDESNAVNVEQRRQEILNDITDTTAAAFLGLTFGCAKCHDHKTDPITQLDYYRLQAFFAGYRPTDLPLVPPDQKARQDAARRAWDQKTAATRAAMAELERPYREAESARQRKRFPDEYARLLDVPAEKRTPLERQLAAMVEKQVEVRGQDFSKKMKGDVKERWDELASRMSRLAKERPADPPAAMGMTDVGPVAPPTHLLKRGDWRKPGGEVAPGFPSAVDDRDAEPIPTPAGTPGRRAALAAWITDPKNPLTARVMVNRVWQHLFGRGIVASASDLGVSGERPTHPELLDWLAADFVAHGWSVKHVYRRVVTAAAYRQAARGSDAGMKADPENALLWQMPRKRLDGESLRDAMLAAAGTLNLTAGGPSVFPELPAELKAGGWKVSDDPAERARRSVYVCVKRNLRYPLFSLFDSPERTETCARRFVTTTAPQALTLLNDRIVLGFAGAFAARVTADAGADEDKVIDRVFTRALSRQPTSEERAAVHAFLAKRGGVTPEAVTDLCHAVLNLNEFLFVD